MKSSFNFEGYRNDLAKDIKQLRQEGQNDLAKEKLEKAREDIRYEIAAELHRLENRIESENGVPPGSVERRREIPPDWERLDISEQIPEWAKLFVDAERIDHLKRKLKIKNSAKKERRLKIIAAYLSDEYMEWTINWINDWFSTHGQTPGAFGDELTELHDMIANKEFSITHIENSTKRQQDSRFEKYITWKFLKGIIEQNIPGMKEANEDYESHRSEEEPYYISVLGGAGVPDKKEFDAHLYNHTIQDDYQFDVNEEIMGSYLWLSDPLTTEYINTGRPLFVFSKRNPAFRAACEELNWDPFRETKMLEGENFRYNHGGRISPVGGAPINLSKRAENKSVKFSEYADAMIDLVHGEMLVHRYDDKDEVDKASE